MSTNLFTTQPSDWTFRQKAVFTIILLAVYRIGVNIPVPYVNPAAFQNALDGSTVGGTIMAAMTMVGSSLWQLGVFALGAMPYITASIIFQLMKIASPRIEEMYKDQTKRNTITQWTRYLTVVLALTQAWGILYAAPNVFGATIFTSDSAFAFITALASMTIGALLVMRIGEEITAKGVSNGTSLIIATSILASIPSLFAQSWTNHTVLGVVGLAAIIALALALISYVEKSEYRINVMYPKSSRRTMVGHTHIPIKVAIAGVLPVIFASSFMSIPMLLASFFNWQWAQSLNSAFTFGSPLYTTVFVLLIVSMTFFSIPMVFDTAQISEQIHMQGGIVVGKRPGADTRNYIEHLANRMAGLDAIYLVAISLGTVFLLPLVGLTNGAFGATSVIILCTVSVTLLAAIDAETASVKAENFLGIRVPKRHTSQRSPEAA